MFSQRARLERERKTLRAMLQLHCRDRHGQKGLCPSCGELYGYAMARLDKCPYGGEKPTCFNCSIHCYKPEMRERIREAMRYAGPRLLKGHPWLSLMHLLDSRIKPPPRPGGKR